MGTLHLKSFDSVNAPHDFRGTEPDESEETTNTAAEWVVQDQGAVEGIFYCDYVLINCVKMWLCAYK